MWPPYLIFSATPNEVTVEVDSLNYSLANCSISLARLPDQPVRKTQTTLSVLVDQLRTAYYLGLYVFGIFCYLISCRVDFSPARDSRRVLRITIAPPADNRNKPPTVWVLSIEEVFSSLQNASYLPSILANQRANLECPAYRATRAGSGDLKPCFDIGCTRGTIEEC